MKAYQVQKPEKVVAKKFSNKCKCQMKKNKKWASKPKKIRLHSWPCREISKERGCRRKGMDQLIVNLHTQSII